MPVREDSRGRIRSRVSSGHSAMCSPPSPFSQDARRCPHPEGMHAGGPSPKPPGIRPMTERHGVPADKDPGVSDRLCYRCGTCLPDHLLPGRSAPGIARCARLAFPGREAVARIRVARWRAPRDLTGPPPYLDLSSLRTSEGASLGRGMKEKNAHVLTTALVSFRAPIDGM